MSLNIAFWVIMLVWLLLSLLHAVQIGPLSGPVYFYWYLGMNAVVYLLFVLVGYRVFGPPLHA